MVRLHVLPKEIRGKTCVLIDVLRATSTITLAIGEGAELVKPVLKVEEALKFSERGYLVAGERGGIKPPDFDLGNSPTEFSRIDLEGRRIVLTTSNGTRALHMMRCDEIYAASFLNLSAVSRVLREMSELDIVCSGTDGEFSLEDFLLAGFILKGFDRSVLDDTAHVAKVYASSVKDVFEEISSSFHARRLIELGFEEDVRLCSRIDLYDVVPVYRDGVFNDARSFDLL